MPSKPVYRSLLILISIAFLICAATTGSAQFAGRYTDGKDFAVYFAQTKYGLTIRPVLWTSTQILRPDGKDRFVVVDRTSRGAEFRRDESGRVTGVVVRGMDGEGLELNRAEGPLLPVELFLAGRTDEALKAYLARGDSGLEQGLDAAEQILFRLPTKTRYVVAFLKALETRSRSNARYHALFGYALVQAGDRRSALRHFLSARSIDPRNKDVERALRMLKSISNGPENKGWTIPFSISSVFSKPTAAEIRAVTDQWAARDLRPEGIREEMKTAHNFDNFTAVVRIVSHLVHGKRHYGAVIVPEGATPDCCPVILEAKGVSPTYFPLNLEGIAAPRMMETLASRFIYVVPSFRGEVLNFKGNSYLSEGDRTDALDGATDDTIALLSVAISTTPEAKVERVCAFGHSRGGTVAMLTGIRDKRVDCVVNWAGPTDWFYLMATRGWTQEEEWTEALRSHAKPTEPGGQNVERFLSKAIAGRDDLTAVRMNMIASSPLYFADRLPLSQHHYGLEDPFVPSQNGYRLVEALRKHKVPADRFQAFFYRDEGHDTDRIEAPIKSRQFIVSALGVR